MLPRGSPWLPVALLALGTWLSAGASQSPSPTAPWSDPTPLSEGSPPSLPTSAPSPDTVGSPKPPLPALSFSPTGLLPSTPGPSLPPSSLAHPTVTLGWGTPGDSRPQGTAGAVAGDSRQQGAREVEMVLLVERVEHKRERPVEPLRAGGPHAMALFLAACVLLLCLFAGIYCAYRRAAKGASFTHQRLQDGPFDDLALHLDSPKGSYEWYFYETEEEKFPPPQAPGQAPPWPYSPPRPPLPAPPTTPGDLAPACSEQPKASPPKLECLSPANLPTGNFL